MEIVSIESCVSQAVDAYLAEKKGLDHDQERDASDSSNRQESSHVASISENSTTPHIALNPSSSVELTVGSTESAAPETSEGGEGKEGDVDAKEDEEGGKKASMIKAMDSEGGTIMVEISQDQLMQVRRQDARRAGARVIQLPIASTVNWRPSLNKGHLVACTIVCAPLIVISVKG